MNNRIKTPGILRYTCRGNRVASGSGKKSGASPVKVPASDLITRRNRVIRPIKTSYEDFTAETLRNTGVKSTITPTNIQCKTPSGASDVASDHGGGNCGIVNLFNLAYSFIKKCG